MAGTQVLTLPVLEQHLATLKPQFAAVLARSSMTPERVVQNMLWSVQRNPKLLEATMDSLVMSAQTAVNLELMIDGVTGQFSMIPFWSNKLHASVAQPIIGYKGYNTLAARENITIDGAEVRDGDSFEYMLGTGGFVRHKPKLGHRLDRPIVGVWSTAAGLNRPPSIFVLDIDEIEAVKAKSPGAKMGDSPWNDKNVGLPAMAVKTAKRRQARVIPFGAFVRAAAIEETFDERGRSAHLLLDGRMAIEGETRLLDAPQPQPQRPAEEIANLGTVARFPIYKSSGTSYAATIEQWRGQIETAIATIVASQASPAAKAKTLEAFRDRMAPVVDELRHEYSAETTIVWSLLEKTIRGL